MQNNLMSTEDPRQNEGRGLVDRKLVEAPSNLIAGRPKAALMFWFFGGLRCDVWSFIFFMLDIKTVGE